MHIEVFQITKENNVRLRMNAVNLDDVTRALPQGYYTTFATSFGGTRVMGLPAHLNRLYSPSLTAGLNPLPEKILRLRIAVAVKTNLPNESRVRVIMAKDSGEIYMAIQPFAMLPAAVYQNGVHVVTVEAARHDPRIKDTGFITESMEQRKLLNRDVFEVLLMKNGRILEGMTSNFYTIALAKNSVSLVTARRGILLGVTRRAVLRVARGEGMGIEYRAPNLSERFNEAFLTSSSRGVVPITSIDDLPVGQGRVGKWTKVLIKAYWDYAEKASNSIVE